MGRCFLPLALIIVVAFSFLTVGAPVFSTFLLSQVLQRLESRPFGGFGAAGHNELDQDHSQADYPEDMFITHDKTRNTYFGLCMARLYQAVHSVRGFACVKEDGRLTSS